MPELWGEGRPEGKNHWKNLGVCRRIIVKWIFRETGLGWGCGMD
jgi:hypothetical protein